MPNWFWGPGATPGRSLGGKLLCVCAGLSADWYPNLDWLKESCRIAGSYNWADVDLSPFQGKKKEYGPNH